VTPRAPAVLAVAETARLAAALIGPLRAYVARRVPADAVDDVVQDLFLRVARSNTEPTDLRAWVHAVARSAIADHFRTDARRSNREPLEETEPLPAPEPAEPVQARQVLAAWLADEVPRLPEPYAETLALTELEGLAHQEVAERLGVAKGTVKARVSRGRALLRGRLHECCAVALDARNGVLDLTPRACGC